jgi:hypothetical protein
LCFLPELPLDLGSAVTLLFGNLEVDALLVNHFVGFERNWEKPEGEFERVVPGDDAEGIRESWGLNVLDDGAPRRGAMNLSSVWNVFEGVKGWSCCALSSSLKRYVIGVPATFYLFRFNYTRLKRLPDLPPSV